MSALLILAAVLLIAVLAPVLGKDTRTPELARSALIAAHPCHDLTDGPVPPAGAVARLRRRSQHGHLSSSDPRCEHLRRSGEALGGR